MKHNNYSISDAAKKLNIEAHVLRYWEEELGLDIPRNDLGHRYYRESDLKTFKQISELKSDGLSLHEIKQTLKNGTVSQKPALSSSSSVNAGSGDKLNQFRIIMDSIISQAIKNNNETLASLICENTSDRVIKELNYLFRTLDEDEEVRISQLKAAINAACGIKQEVAATKVHGKKKSLFGKKKQP